MEGAVRLGGNRAVTTALAVATAAALGTAGFALGGGGRAGLCAGLPAFLLAAIVGIARTTTA